MKIFFSKYCFLLVFILMSIAFFTLMERKVLGFGHNRFGPNKVSYFGLLQPISDVLKLFSKGDYKVKEIMYLYFLFFCFICVFLSVFLWGFCYFWGLLIFSNYVLLFFIILIGMGVYFLLFMGWCSDTKYSLLGSYRSSSQSISYEIILVLCLLFFIFFYGVLDYYSMVLFSIFSNQMVWLLMLLSCWFISCLAESNRSPFDFSEGESELVSGFNTEYGGGFFSFIFIGEYSSIILLSFFSTIFFCYSFTFILFVVFFSFLYLWVRLSFPRLRYDFLMMMAWKGLIFLVLSYFFLWNLWL